MAHWRYKARSITKYNPIYRAEDGAYTKDEWTSRSDVGKVYNGHLFKLEEYNTTEQQYIDAALVFINYLGCTSFRRSDSSEIIMNVWRKDKDNFIKEENEELWHSYCDLQMKKLFSIDDLPNAIKIVLREITWFDIYLNDADNSSIHFGYDYYMYFASDKNIDKIIPAIERLGLFAC